MSGSNPNQPGFTLVEMIVVITVLAIIGVAFFGLAANFFVTIMRNQELSDMTLTSQNLLRATVENIRFGNGVEQSNQISDPNAPSGGWNTSESNFVVILPVPAVTRSKTYIIDPATSNPYMNELVYYKSGAILYERILANPSAAGNSLVTTCPPAQATSSCPADHQLANYVSSMTFTMYDQDASVTTVPADARSIGISLNMQRNAPGSPINLSTNMRVTLRNDF